MLTRIDEKYTLSVPVSVDAENLSEFFSHLNKIESTHVKEIVLDCSRVERASTRYLAILCMAHNKLRRAGVAVQLESIPDNLRQILEKQNMLGLFDQVAGAKSVVAKPKRRCGGRSRRTIEISFLPNTIDIRHAVDVYKAFLNSKGIFELEAFELMTVFYEVVTNIRLHGKLENDDRIDFSAILYEREIVMRFEDPGIPFDPGNMVNNFSPGNAMKARKQRGLGLILIHRLIDSLSYMRSDDGKNILWLKKIFNNGSRSHDIPHSDK